MIRPIAHQLGLQSTAQVADFRQQLKALGHDAENSKLQMPWTVIRLVLHRGGPDLRAVTANDIEQIVRRSAPPNQIPGIDEFLTSHQLGSPSVCWIGWPANRCHR